MRTIYVIGNPLKIKKNQRGLTIPFTNQDLLTALDETSSDQLRLFDHWMAADLHLENAPNIGIGELYQSVVIPIYEVKLPESQLSKVKVNEVKITPEPESNPATSTLRVGRIPPSIPTKSRAGRPPQKPTEIPKTENYISATVIRNKIVSADFGGKVLSDDDRIHFPEAKKLTAAIAYFEEDKISQPKTTFPELTPKELYPLLSNVFDELHPNVQINRTDADHFYKTAGYLVRKQYYCLSQKNWNWSAFLTVLCCLPVVTIPFILVFDVFDGIFEKLSNSDSIQRKKIATENLGMVSKTHEPAIDEPLQKSFLFNKHGELRKINTGNNIWLGTAGQMHRLFTKTKNIESLVVGLRINRQTQSTPTI